MWIYIGNGECDVEQKLVDIDARTEETLRLLRMLVLEDDHDDQNLRRAIRRIDAKLNRLGRYAELNLEADMATNDELSAINDALTEAATEIPAKLDELLAQVGDAADPALVAEIKAKAQALADLVPNEVVEPPVDGESQ